MYSKEEQADILLDYFGPGGTGTGALCPHCGEPVSIVSQVIDPFGLQLEISCAACSEHFSWSQPQPERSWKELHLGYFLERTISGEPIRCPIDDCYVTYAEFSGGILQFNCPYCNRRGKMKIVAE